jgi:hypothetical protein
MRFLTSLFAIMTICLLFGCSHRTTNVKDTSIPLVAGKLVYDMYISGTTLRNAFEVQFDENNVRINEKYVLASKTYIYEKATNEILTLYTEAHPRTGVENRYLSYMTSEEMINEALHHSYGDTSVRVTSEYKTILGYKCRKTVILHGGQVIVFVWTTDKIKTGLKLPWTPLTFSETALEYELKVLGDVDTRYTIKSISETRNDAVAFKHVVLDSFFLIVPMNVFSLDTLMANDYEEETYSSMSYPFYGSGREATRDFLRNSLRLISPNVADDIFTIDFIVLKDGSLNNIEIRCSEKCNYSEKVKKMLQSMPKWTPAKVKGIAVDAAVSLYV